MKADLNIRIFFINQVIKKNEANNGKKIFFIFFIKKYNGIKNTNIKKVLIVNAKTENKLIFSISL